jgi:hypothetical protein
MNTATATVRLARVIVLPDGSRELIGYIVAAPDGADTDTIAAAVDPGNRVMRIDWLDSISADGVTAITRTNERGTTLLV